MAGIFIESEAELELVKEIEEKVLKKLDVGFDLEVLQVLGREDAGRREIEALKELLSPGIMLRLFGMGNSSHYGRLGTGRFTSFFDVVLRLGMEPTKIYIIALSLFSIRPENEFKIVAARSYATSILGRFIARQLRMKEEDVKKVELGGLFLEIGDIFLHLYRIQEQKDLNREFIERFRPMMGLKAVDLFGLPDFLRETITASHFHMRTNSFSISSIVQMANAVVADHFQRHGKMVLQSPVPDADGIVTGTQGFAMANEMDTVGLGAYLEIIPVLSRQQQIHQLRKAKEI